MSFAQNPGLIFVVATLLPLASFVFLLLINGIRSAVRRSAEGSLGAKLYQGLGGEQPRRWPAFVATGAIALAFVCSLWGFIQYVDDASHVQHGHAAAEEVHEKEPKNNEGKPEKPLEENKNQDEGDCVQENKPDDANNKDEKKPAEGAKEKEDRKAEEQKGEQPKEDGYPKTPEELNQRWTGSFTWIGLGIHAGRPGDPSSSLQLGYKIDYLSGVMFVMVTFIAMLIHFFSMGYMSDELTTEYEDHQVHTDHGHLHRCGRYGRFFLYLSLFCFSMLNLLLADNLFQVFLSWELVGVCSFLLIGFYYERKSASNAANKAFIVNRVGDAGFIIGLLIVWTYVGTFNFDTMFQRLRAPVIQKHGEESPEAISGKFVRAQDVEKTDKEIKLKVSPEGADVFLFPTNATVESGAEEKHEESKGPLVVVSGDNVQVTKAYKDERTTMPYWMLVVAGLGIFLGCVGKSAQFPLHVWLPDAMEGPTPVSALIHAATMVAAGVYLVGRCYPIFTAETLLVIAHVGAITLFVAASIAFVLTDIKKVLAYSTVSQLGYMMLALGIGGWVAGLFHLVTHAFFKALLFLGSGSVIHGCHHEQEMTKMGGLYPKMKITALTMLMGVLAISGIPGFSGWYSKDAILASALGFAMANPLHLLLFVLPLITAGLTTFYMFRLWFMTFTGKPRDTHVFEHAHESPKVMTVPLILLAICSVAIAWGLPFFSSHFPFINAESSWLEHQIHHSQPVSVEAEFGSLEGHGAHASEHKTAIGLAHEYHSVAGNVALVVVAIGFIFAVLFYYSRALDPEEASRQFPGLHVFLRAKWYFDELYSAVIVRPSMAIANWCRTADTKGIDTVVDTSAEVTVWISMKNVGRFDKQVVDGLANLIAHVAYAVGGFFRRFQTGYLRNYVLFLVLAAVGIFLVMFLTYFMGMATAAN